MQMLKRAISVLLAVTVLCSVFAVGAVQASAVEPLPHLTQTEAPWGSVVIGGGSIADTGCGVLSLVNAVGYLVGKRIDVVECAKWAHSIKGLNVNGGDGTYRYVLYPLVNEKYGNDMGFTVDCNTDGHGWWQGASSTVLKEHLANGGVAIGHIPNHFIAIVGYDAATKKYHVRDSYPLASRGTGSNRGDVWLSESHMSTGNYKLDWFCLVSADEKGELGNTIKLAEEKRYYDFDKTSLEAFRSAYNNAIAVYNSATAGIDDYAAAKAALESAMNPSNAISVGKSYTATPNNRTDVWKDDGIRLTDGKKDALAGNTDAFSGLGNSAVSYVTVDLGSNSKAYNNFRVYTSVNANWGINVPASVKVLVSADGSNYIEVASDMVSWSVAKDGDWTSYVLNLQSDSNRTERYVKFEITPESGHVWLEEVEVRSGKNIDVNSVYITDVNKRIAAGECNVFTPSFSPLTVSGINYMFTNNVIVKWSESDNAYVVTNVWYGTTIGEQLTLAEDELLICAHDWETGISEAVVYGSGRNATMLGKVKVGDFIYVSGVDVGNSKWLGASYITIVKNSAEDDEEDEPVVDLETPTFNDNLAIDKNYVTSDIYASNGTILYPDEDGITLTDGKTAANDAQFSDVAFVGFNKNSSDYQANGYSSVTVDLKSVCTINKVVANVASSYHDSVGINAPSLIEVYVSNDNQNFAKAGAVIPADDNRTSAIAATITLSMPVNARYVQFRFYANASWMFVAEVEVYGGQNAVLVGDINADGKTDSLDYLIAKRACLGTYQLDEDEILRADVNSDELIDSLDYLLVKRIVLGTYVPAPVVPDVVIPEEPEIENPPIPEDPEDDTPTVPEVVIPDISNDTAYANVVLNKTYTKSNLHPVSSPSYPDENNKTMTDGVRASSTANYTDAAFMAFSRSSADYNANGYSSITVDLGGLYYVDKFVVSSATAKFSKYGIDAPAYVWIYVSNDGKEWYRVGTTTPADSTSVSTVDCVLKLSKAVSAKYIQYRICCNAGGWMFLSEVEAFGVKAEQAVSYPQRTPDKKILFVGNSTTFFFNIPDKLFFLGEAAGMEIDVEYCCGGGAYLYHYADSTTVLGKLFRTKLALKDYDYVVLQDNGNASYEDSKPALDILIPLIEQTGAEVLLYKRYSSNSDPNQRLESAYRHEVNYSKLATDFGIERVAPAADAFLICTEKYPSINLYHTDNSHHNATAAYLVACVFAITYLDMDITNNTYTAGLDTATANALKECAKIACSQGYNYNK